MNVLSVQIGKAEAHPGDPAKRSGIHKRPVASIAVGYAGVEGDAVVDTRYHGGPDKAVCCYSVAGLEHWRAVYPDVDWSPGAFGENLTLAGWHEDNLHVGDLLRIGGVTAQVSQPRGPCGKLSAKFSIRDFVKVCIAHGSTGWYLRVLQPGAVAPGDPAERLAAHPAAMTLAEANRIMYADEPVAAEIEQLLAVDALSLAWREDLAKRLARG